MLTLSSRLSSKTYFRGLQYENGSVATSPLFSVSTRSLAGLPRHRRFTRLIPRSLVRAVFMGNPTESAAGTKAFTPLGTRCCEEAWRFREETETTDMAWLHGSLKFAANLLPNVWEGFR